MNPAPRRGRLVVRKMAIEPEFHQVDMLGMVHNVAYFHWFERGRLALLWEILPFAEAVRLHLGLPVVRHVCEYLKAAHFGDHLVLTTTHEIQPRYEGRLVFRHSLVHEGNKAEIATAETALTIMDVRTGQLVREFPHDVWNRYQAIR